MSSTKELLTKLFNDPNTGFVGAEKLLRRAKLHLSASKISWIIPGPKNRNMKEIYMKNSLH
jgi:hypothetical protein